MKKLLCLLLSLLLLVPMGTIAASSAESRYHGIYESMKVEGAALSWLQLKEVMGGGDTFYPFPELGIKIYDPLDSVSTIDEHHALNTGISNHFTKAGFVLADEGLMIQFKDSEQRTGFTITGILNPEFEGCNVPLNESRNADRAYLYEENTFQVNGMPCASTIAMSGTRTVAGPSVLITSILRVSDDNVLLVRQNYNLGGKLANKSFEEIEAAASLVWEKGMSFLLCLCPLSDAELAAIE